MAGFCFKKMPVYIIPLIGAFIGWLMMQMAVAVFFSPARSKKLVTQMAGSLGGLIDWNSIAAQLTEPEKLKQLTPAIEAHLDQFLGVKLQEKLPVIATFVGPSTLVKIKEAMVEEIDILLPQIIAQYAGTLANEAEISKMITNKLNESTSIDIMIAAAIRPQIKMLGLAGAAIGLISSLVALFLSNN